MADAHANTNGRSRLVLLIDADPATRHVVGPLIASAGLELVQARDGLAGLEILQRLPERFRLAIVSLEMPGISGAVLIGTLRLFRPEIPVVCLTSGEPATAASSGCVAKSVQPDLLREQLTEVLHRGADSMPDVAPIDPGAVARARRSFERSQSLIEAARDLARGMPGERQDGW